jgi:hypothetical protein
MLDYTQRTTRIFDFLFSPDGGDSGGLLRNYTAPEHLSADRQRTEINNLVEDLNSEMPSGLSDDKMDQILTALRKFVRRRHGARSWPTTKVLIAALSDALGEVDAYSGPQSEEEIAKAQADVAEAHFKKHGRACPWANSAAITRELISRRVLPSLREAARLDFSISAKDRDQARSQRMSETEFERHIAITARLRNISESEARQQEIGALSAESLPENINSTEGGADL